MHFIKPNQTPWYVYLIEVWPFIRSYFVSLKLGNLESLNQTTWFYNKDLRLHTLE